MSNDQRDAARYRYLRENCIRVSYGGREGPDHPKLSFHWDIWAEAGKHTWNADGLDVAIDVKIAGKPSVIAGNG